jgi:hypothetical protein
MDGELRDQLHRRDLWIKSGPPGQSVKTAPAGFICRLLTFVQPRCAALTAATSYIRQMSLITSLQWAPPSGLTGPPGFARVPPAVAEVNPRVAAFGGTKSTIRGR